MTHKRPSPDSAAIRGVLEDREEENTKNPISIYEEDLSVNSPISLEKSIGRMNTSFSRTQVVSSLDNSQKLSMDDTKRKLFNEKESDGIEDHTIMQNRQETLVKQLLQQQKELQNLENRQKELTELKRVAEARLAAASHTANVTLEQGAMRQGQQGVMRQGQQGVMRQGQLGGNGARYNLELELPYQIEHVNGVPYEDSEEEEEDEDEGDDSLEILQKRLCMLHEKQKWLERKSKENQEAAEASFNSNDQLIINGRAEEGTFELTGHANDADYEALCGKVNDLKDKKKYMDQLLSYYTLLRQTNNSAEDVMNPGNKNPGQMNPGPKNPGQTHPGQKHPGIPMYCQQTTERDPDIVYQQARYIEPSEQARYIEPSEQARYIEQADTMRSKYVLDQTTELEALKEESNKLRLQTKQTKQTNDNIDNIDNIEDQNEDGKEELRKLNDIKSMRNQLSDIQNEMAGIQFNDDDSVDNVGNKLKGLEQTRNRVKNLRDRLMAFEETPTPVVVNTESEGTLEDNQMKMLTVAREKLEYLHSLSNKVKVARAGNNGIPESLLQEISVLVPEEKEDESGKEEKFTSLLRKKQELETVQNELKQLRQQQELLHNMDQSGEEQRVVIGCDEEREQLWDTLREKQCAQLDRLKRGFEAESCDGYTTRATWGGSSIRSVDTGAEIGEGGNKTNDEEEVQALQEPSDTETQLVYELETNYWVEHCRDLSKQLAERTNTIHTLLSERNTKKQTPDLQRQLEELTIENDHLHSELNEVYGSESYQRVPINPDISNLGKIDESLYSNSSSRRRTPLPFPPWTSYGYPPYYYPPPPPMYPPPPHYPPQHFNPYYPHYSPSHDSAAYQNTHYGQSPSPPIKTDITSHYNTGPFVFNNSSVQSSVCTDPNSPYITRADPYANRADPYANRADPYANRADPYATRVEGDTQGDSLNNTQDDLVIDVSKNRSVSFSQQVTAAGDTISTQFPTPRRHHAAQKLADADKETKGEAVCEDAQSITSTISSYVNEKREKDKTAFDTLQNNVYSEVASLISANEARPHYLIELVRELGGLKNDYLRQRHLYMLRDLISNYIPSEENKVKTVNHSTNHSTVYRSHDTRPLSWPSNNWQLSMSEATPSNNSMASENDFELVKDNTNSNSVQDADYDYLENVENTSSVSTNNSHPFASDSLGATAINLSRDLSDVRQREDMEKKLEDMVQNVIAKYGMKRSESSSAADNTSESSGAISPFDILEQEVKRVMLQVIPLLRDNFSSTLTQDIILEIRDTVINSAGSVFDTDQISENFGSNLISALSKYSLQGVEGCAHDIIVDLSEVLFQDVHTVHIIVDEEEISDVEDIHSPTPTPHSPTPQDLRSTFLASTCGYEESDDPELEFDETKGGEVECAVSQVEEEEEEELQIVEDEGEEDQIKARFSETGDLFSDENMSDIIELPPTDSEDDVPVREITLGDLPTKLHVPSYRDAVLSGQRGQDALSQGAEDNAALLEVVSETVLVGDSEDIKEPTILSGEK